MNNSRQKSFSDMLRERREFVMGSGYGGQGGGNPFPTTGQQPQDPQTQLAQTALQSLPNQDLASALGRILQQNQSFVPQANMSVANYTEDALQNGSNGAFVSPAELNTKALDYYGANNNTTNNLINSILGMAQSQQNNAADRALRQQEINLNAHAQAREDYLNGFDQSGNTTSGSSTTSNPLVDSHVKNFLQGIESKATIDALPVGIRQQVYANLNQQGYDPALKAHQAIDNIEKAYFGGQTPSVDGKDASATALSGVNSGRGINNMLGDFLSTISAGKIQTPTEKSLQNYRMLSKTLQPSIESAIETAGGKPNARISQLIAQGAPTENTDYNNAVNYFKQLRQGVNDTFYPGGNNPNGSNTQSSQPRYKIVGVK